MILNINYENKLNIVSNNINETKNNNQLEFSLNKNTSNQNIIDNNDIINNNNMNNNMFMNMNNLNLNDENFENNKKGKKSFFREIIKINEKYFMVSSTKHVKHNNRIISNYFYISLFNFNNLEEISKIELIKLDSDNIANNLSITRQNNIFIVSISFKKKNYNCKFLYKNAQLIELSPY